MTQFEQLDLLLNEYGRIIQTFQVIDNRISKPVFSHETALLFHDLTDREPLKYTITVRTGYNPSRLQEDGFQVYTIKKDLHETEITTMQTPFGHSVPVYDMERTLMKYASMFHVEKILRPYLEVLL